MTYRCVTREKLSLSLQEIFLKKRLLRYFDAVDPVANMKERRLGRDVVHNNDTVGLPQILSTNAAIFLLACGREKK